MAKRVQLLLTMILQIVMQLGRESLKRLNTVNDAVNVLEDGVYVIDVASQDSGFLHPTWYSHYSNLVVDTSLLIENGQVVRFFGRDSVAARGYVAEMDVNRTPPTQDGYYKVISSSDSWGGGYAYNDLTTTAHSGWASETFADNNASLTLPGTVMKLSGGTWSRVRMGNGFTFRKDLDIYNLGFKDVGMYIVFPSGGGNVNKNRNLSVRDISIENFIRFSALEINNSNGVSTFGAQDSLSWEKHDDLTASSLSDSLYTFRNISITNSNFSEIGQHVYLGLPTHSNLTIAGNEFSNSFNYLGILVHISTEENNPAIHGNISNNVFTDVRDYGARYGAVGNDNINLIRVSGNYQVTNNEFYRVNGALYISAGNNLVQSNTVYYLNEYSTVQPGYVFHNKIADHDLYLPTGNTYKNNTIYVLQGNPILLELSLIEM